MRVFLTGATGFVGSYVVAELVAEGHTVLGLCRSDSSAEALSRAGADVVLADVNDLDQLRAATASAEGVIHAAFNHDFSKIKQASEEDRQVILTLGEALAGSDRPLIVTSGTGLVRSKTGAPVTEADGYAPSTEVPRGACEEAADLLFAKGCRVMVMRLPQVHDTKRQGRITEHIKLAKRQGQVAYIGEGQNRLPAAHVSDVARLYRLALEGGAAGSRYHAVAEEGVPLRRIAEAIGTGLKMPVVSLTPEAAPGYFGWLSGLAAMDLAASGDQTRERFSWSPTGPDLLSDLETMDYSAVLTGGGRRPG